MTGSRPPGGPLRIAALAKQIPVAESMQLVDGRLVREGVDLEMNAYCRRAVAEGVLLARATGGSCSAFTLGPPSAEDVVREAVAWGADAGVHLCDDAFAGSDTLATARALAAALSTTPGDAFDLVLVGRNSLDGETGQVGPELAELLGLPFAGGVKAIEDLGASLRVELELDDGVQEVEIDLPAVLSVAERLCDPCKVDPAGRAAVAAERITRREAAELGPGPWGLEASPTVVGPTHPMEHGRALQILEGPLGEQVETAVRALLRRGALSGSAAPHETTHVERPARAHEPDGPVVAVLLEPGRPAVGGELLGAALDLADQVGGRVEILAPGDSAGTLPAAGREPDVMVELTGPTGSDDVAVALADYLRSDTPWAVLAPSTAFGREVAARAAAATGSGLVGDAIALSVEDGTLIAAKPAFAGALVADISARSGTCLVTIRPGVLPTPVPRAAAAVTTATTRTRTVPSSGRIRLLGERRTDDVETLARAQAVIGVGAGVDPDDYALLSPLAATLGAELAATRKVTDKGWAPRARQLGITGRSIAPRLYVAIALSGKFNHMVGVRAAGTVLAINEDRTAPVFDHCDLGIVGDWHEAVPLLQQALRLALSG